MDTPDKIGPYRVIRPIARGGMAAVYEVEEPKSRQRLALKLLTQRGLAAPRFNREYRALARLNHPNILRVYRFGRSEEGRPYVTMELLDGVPAQVHAKAKGRPGTPQRTARVVRIISAVAEALRYLHARGVHTASACSFHQRGIYMTMSSARHPHGMYMRMPSARYLQAHVIRTGPT